MELSLLLGFLGATAVLAFMPGPDNIYVLSESISKGARQGISITAGLVSGVVVHTLLVATGLSLLVFKSELAYDIVKYAGAAYLLYIAYGATWEQPMQIEWSEKGEGEPFWKLYQRGVIMNLLNPKVSIFFIAFLPQFVSSNGWSPMLQMSVMGLIFMFESFLIFSSIALVAGSLASLVKSDVFWKVTKWVKVVVLISLALLLAFSELEG